MKFADGLKLGGMLGSFLASLVQRPKVTLAVVAGVALVITLAATGAFAGLATVLAGPPEAMSQPAEQPAQDTRVITTQFGDYTLQCPENGVWGTKTVLNTVFWCNQTGADARFPSQDGKWTIYVMTDEGEWKIYKKR